MKNRKYSKSHLDPVSSFGGSVPDSSPTTTPEAFQYQPPQPEPSEAEIRAKNQELANSLQEQLRTVNQSLADSQAENESINRQIVEANNNAQYYNHQADEFQSRLRVDFINSAADRRWYPQEHSQWKAYLFQAVCFRLDVLQKRLTILRLNKTLSFVKQDDWN